METAYTGLLLWARAVNEMKSLEPRRTRHAMTEHRFSSPVGEVRLDPDTLHCYKTPHVGQIRSDGSVQIGWSLPEPVPPDPFPDSRTATQWLALLDDVHASWGNRWSAP
jgi:urea transport system substrate-binding protein